MIRIFFITLFLLTSCFPGGDFFEQEESDLLVDQKLGVNIVGETSVAQVFASANATQTIEVPSGSALEGTSLSIPPGALNINMNITIQEAVSVATDSGLSSIGIVGANTTTVATVFSNDQGVTEFSNGKAGTIQISTGSSTASLALTQSGLPVMYSRHNRADGSCVDTIFNLESSDFTTLESGIEIVKFVTPYFGTYQVIWVPDLEFSSSPKTTQWGTTILAENVPNECKVVTKTEKKQLDQESPLTLGSVKTSLDGQILKVSAPAITEKPKSCTLTIRDGESGAAFAVGSASEEVIYDLSGKGFPLKSTGTFECQFVDGRTLKERSFKLPWGIRVDVDKSSRKVTGRTSLPKDGACDFIASLVNGDSLRGSVSDPSNFTIDFEGNSITDFELEVACSYNDGRELMSPQVSIALGTCQSCDGDSGNEVEIPGPPVTEVDLEAPVVTDIMWGDANIQSPGTSRIRITATDNQSGVKDLCLAVRRGPTISHLPLGCSPLVAAGANQYDAYYSIHQFYNSGDFFEIAWFEVIDGAGNSQWFEAYSASSFYYGYELSDGTHVNQGMHPDIYGPIGSTVAAASGNTPDNSLPDLASLSFVNSNIVSKGSDLALSFSFINLSGSLSDGSLIPSLCIDLKQNFSPYNITTECGHVDYISPGMFHAKFFIHHGYEAGTYKVEKLYLTDPAGNTSYFHANASYYMEAPSIPVPVFSVNN